MATSYGPQYPGLEDGLIFCFDPKNRDSWTGGGKTSTQVFNMVKGTSGSVSFENADEEWAGAITSQGYIDYDGTDDYIQMEDTNSTLGLSGSNQITVAWWGARDATIPPYGTGFGGHGTSAFTDGWGVWIGGNQQLHWEIKYGTDALDLAYSSTGEWVLATGTYDGINLKLYINGTLEATEADDEIITGTSNIWMGRASGADNYYFNGKVGPCMIWNRPLSAAEVLTNYNRLKGRFGL